MRQPPGLLWHKPQHIPFFNYLLVHYLSYLAHISGMTQAPSCNAAAYFSDLKQNVIIIYHLSLALIANECPLISRMIFFFYISFLSYPSNIALADSIKAAARSVCTILIERQHTEREAAKSPVQSRAADCQPNTKNLIGATPYLTAASQKAVARLLSEQCSLTQSNPCWQTCR